ncbi:MAG: carboxypeptidase regulatory-like domain-containing protein [Myxococcales bacterium]
MIRERRYARWLALPAVHAAAILAGCGSGSPSQPEPASRERKAPAASPALTVAHSYDLAANMPARLSIMFSMSWFGIPASDPQGAGPDPTWGNWKWGGGCVATNDPTSCNTAATSTPQRFVASRRRPLAGVYSSSGRDAESLRRVDLMLSTLRRSCDDGARIDAWSVQIDSIRDTSRHPTNPQSPSADLAYRALLAFLNQADAAGLGNKILPGNDSTWYFHFGANPNVQLGKCDGTAGNPKQSCLDALTSDIVEMVQIAAPHSSALRINGKLVLLFYLDAALMTVAEWQAVLQNARDGAGQDFYALATTQNSSYFGAFDALAPWISTSQWGTTSGATVYDHATSWTAKRHSGLLANVGAFGGRVVFGGAAPGFDDYTKNWGACTERQLPTPPDQPRDPAVLQAQFDYFKAHGLRGVVLETWDDWTEGSEFEPDVANGTGTLVQLRQLLGSLFGDASDPAGDTRLSNRWTSYGQARNCAGGTAGTPPVTDLSCIPPNGGTIGGKITNLSTGGAIGGGTVSYTGGSTTSDAAGNYTLPGVPAGTVTITASATGYLKRSYDVAVTAGATTVQDVQLSTSGKLVGNVTAGGAPLSGASVRAQGGQIATDVTDTTDAAGHYDEGWLAIGTYTVTCSAPGYATQTVPGVSVTTGGTTTVDCALTGSAGAIAGKVTNVQTAGAIANATISYIGGSTTSDAAGNYTLSGVPAGTVTITATATGYLMRSYDVAVTGGATATQNVQLSTSGKLVGDVTGDGVALSGASVRAQGGQIATDATDTTDAAGHYDEGWLAIGSYTVTCSAAGFSPQTVTGVSVTTGGTTTVNCALASKGTVSGKVTNLGNGQALSSATVSWSGGSTVSDAAGSYTLSGVPAGTQVITGTHTGYLARSYTIDVAGGATTPLDVQLSTSGKIAGNVTGNGAALSGASARAQGGQIPTDVTDITDATGHYDEGWVPIGTYSVTCSAPGFQNQVVSGVTVTSGVTSTVNCALGTTPATDPVFAGAGDVACGVGGAGQGGACAAGQTAAILRNLNPTMVWSTGDTQYPWGALADYQDNTFGWNGTWGGFNSILAPAVGNHEYHNCDPPGCTDATVPPGYVSYFKGKAPVIGQTDSDLYYSFDLQTAGRSWHVIVIDSGKCYSASGDQFWCSGYTGSCSLTNAGQTGNCTCPGPDTGNSRQNKWLCNDLATHKKAAFGGRYAGIIALWHQPRFASVSGGGGDNWSMTPVWNMLYNYKADIVLTGHAHYYERFDATGHISSNSAETVADPNGIRHWVVGTGGVALNTGFATAPHTTSAKRLSSFGVLKLTLHDASYDAQFIDTNGTVLDSVLGVSTH